MNSGSRSVFVRQTFIVIFLVFLFQSWSFNTLKSGLMYHRAASLRRLNDDGKEQLLRTKRLKQIVGNGGSYQDFLEETHRYERMNTSDSHRLDIMKKVIGYENQKIISTNFCKDQALRDVVFLPDCGYRCKDFVPLLNQELDRMTIIDMPNIYDFNTKRYESLWMDYMRQQAFSRENRSLIIAHGTSADAVLRYIETVRFLRQ